MRFKKGMRRSSCSRSAFGLAALVNGIAKLLPGRGCCQSDVSRGISGVNDVGCFEWQGRRVIAVMTVMPEGAAIKAWLGAMLR